MNKYLIINIGSVSKKYALFTGEKELCRVHFEKSINGFSVGIFVSGKKEVPPITQIDYENSLEYLFKMFVSKNFLTDKKDIHAIGMRIVASGTYFQETRIINDEFIKKLKDGREEAPLHIEPILKAIEEIKITFSQNIMVGVSDSAFHKNMPRHAQLYGIPQKFAKELDLKRFGYHSISLESILFKIKNILGTVPRKVIICHLGGGGSITAIKDGKSVETSMGFSPLEGLMTTTRSGNLDPVAVMYLYEKMGKTTTELETYLNKECGLLGISGTSSDIRDLIISEKKGDENAKLALDMFVHHIKKHIGAYSAIMDGLDLLVFSGTVGERSFVIRERICADMDFLGIKLNSSKNNHTDSKDAFISSWSSGASVAVICTDEVSEILRQTTRLA